MLIGINYGREHLQVEVGDSSVVPTQREPAAPPLADPAAALAAAVETPHGFPALRRALTPDDHVAVVVEERLPRFVPLLAALLEHVAKAGIPPEAITLVCLPSSSGH